MSVSTTYIYDTPGNFAYDATKIGVAGGKASILAQRPTGAVLYAAMAANLNDASGTPTGTAIGAGAIASGHLDGNSTSPKGAKWSVATLGQTGCLRFTAIPQYTGTPGAGRYWFAARMSSGAAINLIRIYHQSDAKLYAQIFNSSGAMTVELSANFAPVSGTSYEVEVNYDFTGGTHRLFVNGAILSTVTGTTGTRTAVAEVALGTSHDDTSGGSALYSSLQIFSAVQHTATYTPFFPYYDTTNPTIQPNSPITLDEILTFTASIDASGSDGVRFYLLVNNVPKYWNGSAWATSDTTYAQSSTAAQISANCVALGTALEAAVYPVAILHSADGTTRPDIVSLTSSYNYFGVKPAGPNYCVLWGYLTDVAGAPIVGATVRVTITDTYANQGFLIMRGTYDMTSDSAGYFSASLEESATVGVKYSFSVISGGKTTTLGKASVPNQPNANIASMVFA